MNEWKNIKIGDVGKIVTGSTPITSDKENYGNDYSWVSPADLGKTKYIENTLTKLSKKGFDKTRKIPANSILVTCIGSTIGKMGMTKIEMSTNQQINSIIVNKEAYDENFIYYCINYNFPKFLNKISSQAVPIISKSEFEKLEIKAPNLVNQKKIGIILTLLDKKIELQSKKIEALKLYKLCNMNNFFTSPDNIVPLKKIATIEKGKQINSEELLEQGMYYMLNGGIVPSGYLNDYNTLENTITISEGGNSCGYVNFNKEKFWCGGHCYTIKPININNNYLFQLLKYNENKIMRLRVGSGLPNIQKKDLENFNIKVHEIKDQDIISTILFNYDNKINLEINKLNKLQELKKGLMQNMFV